MPCHGELTNVKRQNNGSLNVLSKVAMKWNSESLFNMYTIHLLGQG